MVRLVLHFATVVAVLVCLVPRAARGDSMPPHKSPVTVFLVPHSHDDVGWTSTIKQYYDDKVQFIYDTITDELTRDPTRRFISVEQAFVQRWWNHPNTTSTRKANFRKLVHNGQLEFVLGGWVMHDEAVTTMSDQVNQMTVGHRFILETFGVTPSKGWQIDPFGSSAATPTLFARMGFDATVTNRINFETKSLWQNSTSLEFVWDTLPPKTGSPKDTLFAHVMDEFGYCCPDNPRNTYYWDDYGYWGPSGEPMLNETSLPVFAARMLATIYQRAAWMKTDNLLFPWGCDFEFHNATIMYPNMDKVIAFLNANSTNTGVTIKYAVLSEYFDAVASAGASWSTFHDDFFPYDDAANRYWTGFYASRSEFKGMVRRSSALLRATELLYVLAWGAGGKFPAVRYLRRVQGECQHHDAVTGTELDFVLSSYEADVSDASSAASEALTAALASIVQRPGQQITLTTQSQPAMSLLGNAKPGTAFVPVAVFNPLAWNSTSVVNVTVPRLDCGVWGPDGTRTRSQVIQDHDGSLILFFVASVPPLGVSTYFVGVLDAYQSRVKSQTVDCSTEVMLGNSFLRALFKANALPNNGACELARLENTASRVSAEVTAAVLGYPAAFNTSMGPVSNAYWFIPSADAAPVDWTGSDTPPRTDSTVSAVLTTGPLVQQLYVPLTGTASITYRLFASGDPTVDGRLELIEHVPTLPKNTELITRVQSDVASGGVFYTDANGWQTMQRKLDPTVGSNLAGHIAGNFYPSAHGAFIRDAQAGSATATPRQLSVFFDRSHGVSSRGNGQLEFLEHRRLFQVDAKGDYDPGTIPLNDTSTLNVVTWLHLDTVARATASNPSTALRLANPPVLAFSDSTVPSTQAWRAKVSTSFAPLSASLPLNVHLLSLEALPGSQLPTATACEAAQDGVPGRTCRVTVRLSHLFDATSSPNMSVPEVVDCEALLRPWATLTSWNATTLTTVHLAEAGATTTPTVQPLDILTYTADVSTAHILS